MKRKHSERSEQTKSKPKCECCLKTIKSEADSCEFTAKIVKQFLQFTTLEVNRISHVVAKYFVNSVF